MISKDDIDAFKEMDTAMYRGPWTADKSYNVSDIVNVEPFRTFAAVKPSKGVNPVDSEEWAELVESHGTFVASGRWGSGVNANPARDEVRDMMASGMYGGPPIHRTHPDAIVVNTTPLEYECPACKARGTDLANPCTSQAAIPA